MPDRWKGLLAGYVLAPAALLTVAVTTIGVNGFAVWAFLWSLVGYALLLDRLERDR